MRRNLTIIIPVVCVLAGLIGGYYYGYYRGYGAGTDYGFGIQRGTAIIGFSALDEMRQGKTQAAIDSLEPLVFQSFVGLDNTPRWHDWTGFETILPSVKIYRDAYLKSSSPAPVYSEMNDLIARRASR